MSSRLVLTTGWELPDLPNARCTTDGIPPDAFYAEGREGDWLRRKAKEFCRPCPVRMECLQWALKHEKEWGVWGGLDPRERKKLKGAA